MEVNTEHGGHTVSGKKWIQVRQAQILHHQIKSEPFIHFIVPKLFCQ